MKKIFLPLLVLMLGLAGCQTSSDDFTVVSSDAEFESDCIGANCAVIRFSSPNGNDLVLETSRHVIQIDAQPGVAYSYYVWAGDKDTTDDADLIVRDGQAMVLTTE
ncbi:MAG: hypothetical protein E7006_01070 [Alphaproteobacteria bacterium]|nr:hypothetical protein [Alphaproteobacteria bacterium]